MDYNNVQIKQMLDKYFEGETTVIEEAVLRDYFRRGGDIPREMEYARVMFTGLRMAEEAVYAPRTRSRSRKLFVKIFAAAASIAIIAVSSWIFVGKVDKQVYAEINGKPITDKEYAIRETNKILAQVSGPLNKQVEEIKQLSEISEKIGLALQTMSSTKQ